MLSAATGMVVLPSSLTFADAPRTYSAQRQSVFAESGTARPEDESKNDSVQSHLNRIYSQFPRSARTEEAPVVAPAPKEMIANSASKTKDAKGSVKQAEATTKTVGKATESMIRQASNEVQAGSREPGRLPESALNSSSPARTTTRTSGVRQVGGVAPGYAQAPQNSEVQRKLDELYRKNGKEMPSMQMQDLPERNLQQKLPPLPQQQFPQNSTPVAQGRVSNFFKSISPFKKSANDERPAHTEKLNAEQLRQQQQMQGQVQPTYGGPNNFNPAHVGLIPPPPAAPPAEFSDAPALLPGNASSPATREIPLQPSSLPEFRPIVQLPPGRTPLKQEIIVPMLPDAGEVKAAAAAAITEAAPALPQLSDKVSEAPFAVETEVKKVVTKAANSLDDLDNPFPEQSEAEADGKLPTKPKLQLPTAKPELKQDPKPEAQAEEDNPFTGLKLDAPAEQPAANNQPPLLPTPSAAKPAPFMDDDDDDDDDNDDEMEAKAPAADPQADKLRKIAERAELRGFKGFCPVTLRDQRDLLDARPQFRASYQGKLYHFATAEARDKFEKSPKSYAPVANGNDIIASKAEGTDVEGSLDHAVWFRDRLYLFSTAKSKAAFEGSPAKYATE